MKLTTLIALSLLFSLMPRLMADCAVCCASVNWGSQQGVIHFGGGTGNSSTACYMGTDGFFSTAVNTCDSSCGSCICNIPTCKGWTGHLDCVSPNGAGSSSSSSAPSCEQRCQGSSDCGVGGCCSGGCCAPSAGHCCAPN